MLILAREVWGPTSVLSEPVSSARLGHVPVPWTWQAEESVQQAEFHFS